MKKGKNITANSIRKQNRLQISATVKSPRRLYVNNEKMKLLKSIRMQKASELRQAQIKSATVVYSNLLSQEEKDIDKTVANLKKYISAR